MILNNAYHIYIPLLIFNILTLHSCHSHFCRGCNIHHSFCKFICNRLQLLNGGSTLLYNYKRRLFAESKKVKSMMYYKLCEYTLRNKTFMRKVYLFHVRRVFIFTPISTRLCTHAHTHTRTFTHEYTHIHTSTHTTSMHTHFPLTDCRCTPLFCHYSFTLAQCLFHHQGLDSKVSLLLLQQFQSLLTDLSCLLYQLHLAIFKKLIDIIRNINKYQWREWFQLQATVV